PAPRQCLSRSRAASVRSSPRRLGRNPRNPRARQRGWRRAHAYRRSGAPRLPFRGRPTRALPPLRGNDGAAHARQRSPRALAQPADQSGLAVFSRLCIARGLSRWMARLAVRIAGSRLHAREIRAADAAPARRNCVSRQADSQDVPIAVTLLVIAYRMRATIAEAVRSALAQTYPCEIIVSDDSSRDGTLEAGREALAGDPRA